MYVHQNVFNEVDAQVRKTRVVSKHLPLCLKVGTTI